MKKVNTLNVLAECKNVQYVHSTYKDQLAKIQKQPRY